MSWHPWFLSHDSLFRVWGQPFCFSPRWIATEQHNLVRYRACAVFRQQPNNGGLISRGSYAIYAQRRQPVKTAIVVMSDPKGGSEQALGRVFNALSLASECKQKGDEVAVVFNGTGTRWPAELNKLSHPAMASTIRFAMSCKVPHAAVRRSLEQRTVSSRVGYRL